MGSCLVLFLTFTSVVWLSVSSTGLFQGVHLSWQECWRLFAWQVCSWAGSRVDNYLCDWCAVELEGVLTVICVTGVQLSWKECWWLFVWQVCDYEEVPVSITGQLIWREYFYCMSVNNPSYNRIKGNPICLDIDWYHNNEHFEKWSKVKLPTKFCDLPIKCNQRVFITLFCF